MPDVLIYLASIRKSGELALYVPDTMQARLIKALGNEEAARKIVADHVQCLIELGAKRCKGKGMDIPVALTDLKGKEPAVVEALEKTCRIIQEQADAGAVDGE